MSEPIRPEGWHGPIKETELPPPTMTWIDMVRDQRKEIARLRAMLPSSVEVLPTEPGWYWTRRRNGEWVLMEVYMGWSKQLLATVDGREHAEPIREFRSLAPFYGPLRPPEVM